MAKSSTSGATTSPELVAGVIEYLQKDKYQTYEASGMKINVCDEIMKLDYLIFWPRKAQWRLQGNMGWF